MKFKILSIVIPVYNEELYIDRTLEKVISAKSYRLKKEIVIIDDGSTDRSKSVIQKAKLRLKKKYPSVLFKEMYLKSNQGKGAALKQGFLKTTGDVVIVQDADLEYDPDEYTSLLEPFFKYDADVVYGSRFISTRPHRILYFWHSIVNSFLTAASNIFTNFNLTDMETGYKVFRGDLIRKIAPHLESKRFGFEPEITARIAKIRPIRLYEIGIAYNGRTYGEGKKIGWTDGLRALWEIVKYNLFTR